MTRQSRLGLDRLAAVVFVLALTLALAGMATSETGATLTAGSDNPGNQFNTLLVQPPASQNPATSAAAGVVNLSWTATPTAPGAGHTLTYLVLRGPVGGPYSQVGSTTSLVFADTPPADGSYGYVIEAKVTGGGSFTSADSAAQTGVSDRTAPTAATGLSSAKGSVAGTINLSWTAGTDGGTGVAGYTILRTNVITGGACPVANTTNYPNTISVGAVTAYTATGLVSGSKYCFYLVTLDAAGNQSANSLTTGPTAAK